MPFEIYDTLTLAEVIRVQKPPTTYWLDNFFPRTITFETEEILFDVVVEDRRLAPFVSPNVQGRVMREIGYSTKSFRPAYVKPKHVVTPQRAVPRMAGEAITGAMSLQEKYNALVAYNMGLEKDQVMRRWDWMAAQAVINSSVTVEGDDYPSVTVDFGRDPSLSVQLTGAALWSSATAKPIQDIENLRAKIFNLSRQPVNRLTFGLEAWTAFSENPEIVLLLNKFYSGSDSVYNRSVGVMGPYEFRGSLSGQNGMGQLDLWTYNDFYEDDFRNTVPYMDPTTVVLTGPGLQGVRTFGAIMDRAAGLVAVDMFPKMWFTEDPSTTYTMTQSAPLMIPAQPNGSGVLKVV